MRGARRWGAAALAALLVAGCLDRDVADEDDASDAVEALDTEGRPTVEVPQDTPPPDDLVVEDLEVGDGDPVVTGSVVTLHLVGVRWSDGAEVTSTWDRGQPLTHAHGQQRWIPGLERAVEGMRAGGRRRVVVPPELGYGARGAPGVPAGETLVFLLDVLEVT